MTNHGHEECDTCGLATTTDATIRERDTGAVQCDTCYADTLAYGHFHGMHCDEAGADLEIEGCPTCEGRPSAYPH